MESNAIDVSWDTPHSVANWRSGFRPGAWMRRTISSSDTLGRAEVVLGPSGHRGVPWAPASGSTTEK